MILVAFTDPVMPGCPSLNFAQLSSSLALGRRYHGLALEYWHWRSNSGYHIQLFHERLHDHSPSLPSDGSGCFV
jgi:hypothetical protein